MIKEIKKDCYTLQIIILSDVSQTLKALPLEVGPPLCFWVIIHVHGSENEPVETLLKHDMQKYI